MPKGRLPQDIRKVPVKVSKALKLRDFLTKSGTKERLAGICLTELSQLFLCFKQHSFSQEACALEIKNFEKCYLAHVAKREELGSGKSKNQEVVKNVEKLLKKFPTI